MSIKYVLYDPLTGDIKQVGRAPNLQLMLDANPGYAVIEGEANPFLHKVQEGSNIVPKYTNEELAQMIAGD